MVIKPKLYQYFSDAASFKSSEAMSDRMLYFPLCGANNDSIKSSITPFLSGDIKIDKNRYLTKPFSREDLRSVSRNFYLRSHDNVISFADKISNEHSTVEAGFLWHKVTKTFPKKGLELQALNFVPVSGENVELMKITCKNVSSKNISFTPTGCVPMFARALSNKHDHEHVTALLQTITQTKQGVIVEPTMLFNEEGHKDVQTTYFVFGFEDSGNAIKGTFPTMACFCGDAGTLREPQAVCENLDPKGLTEKELNGEEAIGAIRFEDVELKAGDLKEYYIVMGIAENNKSVFDIFSAFDTGPKFEQALTENKKYWQAKIHSIEFNTGSTDFNAWMKWVTLQPVLRRIFGCSFLPDHDYGKGGRGWRDIWQDLLSLILIEPENVREHLLNNFAGVRIDGSNATIIGDKPGEFLADRNAITRVWMDHGVWPFMTLLLYINQTGDFDILFEDSFYFKDPQISRTFHKDLQWHPKDGKELKDVNGNVYQGSILEHILVQHLVQFFNVGEHNMIRLENADWNDGLDMAFDRGESVSFTSFYAGNLMALADLLERVSSTIQIHDISVAQELLKLLDGLGKNKVDYNNADAKRKHLFDVYFPSVQPNVSGEKTTIAIKDVVLDLRAKGESLKVCIRSQEKIVVDDKSNQFQWFNGYYDNKGNRVEGKKDDTVWMTLTGAVFPIMCDVAEDADVENIVKSVNHFLKDQELGGYRLNTNFGKRNYLDLGRAFGFAFGTKENGAFFSHMIVMYAYALYTRGFVREGYEVLHSIYQMCMNTDKSKIYPGVPEYCDAQGQGMYHYLTGSASWLVLTQLTQVFGVRGEGGDLVISPKLVKEEFSHEGKASVESYFAGKRIKVVYHNEQKLDYGSYTIKGVSFKDFEGSVEFSQTHPAQIKLSRAPIQQAPSGLEIQIQLG